MDVLFQVLFIIVNRFLLHLFGMLLVTPQMQSGDPLIQFSF